MEKCKIHMKGHPLKQSLDRGIGPETINKIVREGNDIRGKYKNHKYRKLGKIEVSFIPKVCNIFLITAMRR